MRKHQVAVWAAVISIPVALLGRAATVAHWDFDSAVSGSPVPLGSMAKGGTGGVPAIPDLSGGGHTMYAWDDHWGPEWSAWGDTPTGVGYSSLHDGHDDGYVFSPGLVNWQPLTWTIELSVRLTNLSGWRTMIGRDGSTGVPGEVEAGFYFQKNDQNQRFRINFSTVGGQRYILDSNFAPQAGQWYHLAAVSDGSTLQMWADKLDGNGFQLVGSMSLNPSNDNRLRATGTWTFGRGWWNNLFVDHIFGSLDNIRFSDTALSPSQFIQVPEPSALTILGLGGLTLLVRMRRSPK
ncbi:MAG: LamG domain-containing protein [Verrucomicrobiota bacterium]|nr:LamG domain-containing protein [Limisphaera sp.]MDW8382104.1 LamG domain-containing protein [Verrucomicrobiota bacterium]